MLLITISFGAKGIEGIGNGEVLNYLFNSDWWKGNHNPNGKTGMLSIRTPLFDSQNDTDLSESRLTAYTITLTDFITMQYSTQKSKYRFNTPPIGENGEISYGEWQKSTINSTEVYLHLPLYKLWE